MDRKVRLYDLGPSPNNIKVRLALAYKKIPYEKIPVDPQNREPLVKISGQPLAPVMLHGEIVVYDSYAILRYLDANFPGTPRLYGADRETIKKVEEWELFARTEAGPPVGMIFRQMHSTSPDAATFRKANEQINRAAARVEEVLARGPHLLGETLTAADFSVASMLLYGALPEGAERTNPVAAFFRKCLAIEGAPKTREWISRMMTWDR
jgi:glutathione S-transferase